MPKSKQTAEFLEAWNNLDEAYMSRSEIIKRLQEYGCHYNFTRFTDQQLYHILQKTIAKAEKEAAEEYDYDYQLTPEDWSEIEYEVSQIRYCDCGIRLNDAGECPLCDLNDESVLDD